MSVAILMLISAAAAPPDVSPRPSQPKSMVFACDSQKKLQVEIYPASATVHTSSASYQLARRASSIGQRFSSDMAAFAVDEDRGVFITSDEGPYRGCRLVSSRTHP